MLGQKLPKKNCTINFYQFGELRKIKILFRQQSAFIEYSTRQAAETAATASFNKLTIKGSRIAVRWAKPPAKQSDSSSLLTLEPIPGLPGVLPPPQALLSINSAPSVQPPRDSSSTNSKPDSSATAEGPPSAAAAKAIYAGATVQSGPRPAYMPSTSSMFPPPPPQPPSVYYPSQDPQRMGSGKYGTYY